MKSFLALIVFWFLAGCAHRQPSPPSAPPPPVPEADRQLASRFLNALYRPHSASHRIIIDAESGRPNSTLKLEWKAALESRLHVMRTPKPSLVVELTTDWNRGIYVFNYNLRTGHRRTISEGTRLPPSERPDLRLDVDHSPDGSRSVTASFGWLSMPRWQISEGVMIGGEAFELAAGERTFRYTGPSIMVD